MRIYLALISCLAASSLSGCYGLYGHDEMERYVQRSDTLTMSAGDAKEVNARQQMLNPWSPGVGDRRIPADGARIITFPPHADNATGTGSALSDGA